MSEDSCFGEFPFTRPCDRATCLNECDDIKECMIKTHKKELEKED